MRAASVYGVTFSHDSRAIAYNLRRSRRSRCATSTRRSLARSRNDSPAEGLSLDHAGPSSDRHYQGGTLLGETAALWSVSALGGVAGARDGHARGNDETHRVHAGWGHGRGTAPGRKWRRGISTGAFSSGTLQRYEPAPFESPRLVNNPRLGFSPDGRQLLLMWNPVDGEQAWLLPYPPDPAHPPRRILRELPTFNGTPTFSWMPDSRHIVVSTSEPGRPISLYVADTGQKISVARGRRRHPHLLPRWSRRMARSSSSPKGTRKLDIVTLDLDRGRHAADRHEPRGADAGLGSADAALVYVTDRSGRPEIWFREPGGAIGPW